MMSNPYLQLIEAIKSQSQRIGESSTTTDFPNLLDEAEMGKDVYDCPVCDNTGVICSVDADGARWAKECECMKTRRSLRRIKRSGLADTLERNTFDAYETPDAKRKAVLNGAKAFCDADKGWFYIAGRSGSGKTHICTAICGELMKQADVLYVLWRELAPRLKAIINEPEYAQEMHRLKTVPVLYIDDFLKGSNTDADINLAFELLNARYNDAKLRTIISSEFPIDIVLQMDEGLGSRIYERSRGFMVMPPEENWRMMH